MMASPKQELRGGRTQALFTAGADTPRPLARSRTSRQFSDFVLLVIITGFLLNVVATTLYVIPVIPQLNRAPSCLPE
jgi:hypothetical protein